MAFINALGQLVSFDCSDLIEELREDIAEFGGDLIVEVVTEKRRGVTIYKEYNFLSKESKPDFKLSADERLQRMTASALLILYEQENSIL